MKNKGTGIVLCVFTVVMFFTGICIIPHRTKEEVLKGVETTPVSHQAVVIDNEPKAVTSGAVTTITPTKAPQEIEGTPIKYDQKYSHLIKNTLETYTYTELQTVSEAIDIDNTKKVTHSGATAVGKYKLDTKNSRVFSDISILQATSGITDEYTYKIRADYKKELFYIKEGTADWKQYKKSGVRVLGFKKKDTIYTVFNKLTKDIIKSNMNGVSNEGVDTFTYRREPKEKELDGTVAEGYKAFYVDVTVCFDSVKHTPTSVVEAIAYGRKEATDVLTNTIYFNKFSNKQLTLSKSIVGKKNK